MGDDHSPEEEILERLRAADPAAGVRTDRARLRRAVDARIGAATVTPLVPARSRRSRLLAVAAVAAGALVVGAAGFGMGRGTAHPVATTEGGRAGEPAISLGQDAGAPEGGTDEAGPLAAGAQAAIYPAPTISRTDFRAAGLSDEAGTAAAWTYDPAASFSAERTAALGAHLGVPGEPERSNGAWQLGVTDGSGASLTVWPDGTTSVGFYDPAKDPHQCPAAGGDATAPDAPGSAEPTKGAGAPAYEWCEAPDAEPAPRGEDAIRPVRDLLAAAGLDPAGFELVDNSYGDPGVTEVVAHQLVGGERSGSAWYVAVTAAGVQSFTGSLAPLTSLGELPVISPTEAVARLADPRFGTFGDVHILGPAEARPLAADGATGTAESGADRTSASGAAQERTAEAPAAGAAGGSPDDPVSTRPGDGTDGPPPAATPGSPVPWPVEQVTITGARLGPALWTTPSGTALLVPAYELSADDGRTWSVLAVAEDALDLTP